MIPSIPGLGRISVAPRSAVGASPPPPPPPPGAPTDFTATAIGPTQIQLAWTNGNGFPPLTKTEVQRSTDGGSTWLPLAHSVETLSQDTIDSFLTPDTTYTYRVRERYGTNFATNGEFSSTDAATTTSLAAVGSRALITPDDIRYLGFYTVDTGGDTTYNAGLTLRRRAGVPYLMFLQFLGNVAPPGPLWGLRECSLPGSFGGAVSSVRYWADIWDGTYYGAGCYQGIDWDEETGRLWHTGALYYPQEPVSQSATTCTSVRELNDDGTIANFRGHYGFEGVGQRAVYGGVIRVPAWFVTAHSTGPYMHGFGGGHSLSLAGLYGAVGPYFVFPDYDISDDASGSAWGIETPTVDAADFRLGADTRSGVAAAAYWPGGSYETRTADRGVRVSRIQNFLDDGVYPSNPTGFPVGTVVGVLNTTPVTVNYASTVTPNSGDLLNTGAVITLRDTGIVALDGSEFTVTKVDADTVTLDGTTAAGTSSTGTWFMSRTSASSAWYSPAPGDPDGWGRWTWGDSYGNTPCWVDNDAGTRTRHGIIAVANVAAGRIYYAGSAGHIDSYLGELHVYDPADVAAVLAGSLDPWKIRPTCSVVFSFPGADSSDQGFNSGVAGAAFDPVDGRLYVHVTGIGTYATGYKARIYVFEVRGS